MSETTSSGRTAPTSFVRQATGFVREGRTKDAVFYSILWNSAALSLAFFWILYPFYYQGSNAILAALIAACFGLPGAVLYAILTQIMPRSGGDYVFNSRILTPAIGFAANFSWVIWSAITLGVYSTYVSTYGLGALCRMFAGFSGSTGWLDVGNWFATEWGLFITGSVMMIVTGLIFALGGLRLFFKIQLFSFILYIVGAFGLVFVVGLFQNSSGFASNFNEYASNLGVEHAMAALKSSAAEGGFAPSGFDLGKTVLAVSAFWYIFGFSQSSTYFAGEIQQRKRTHMLAMPGAVLLTIAILVLVIPAYNHMAGYSLNAMFGLAEPAAYGFSAGAPAYPEIAAIGSGNAVLGAIIILGFTIGLYMWVAGTFLLSSRSMFAWSFDRIMPQKLAFVDKRTHAPIVAVGLITLMGIGATAIYAFTTWFSTLSVLLGYTTTLIITAIAGILLPFRRPDLIEGSPFRRKLAGLPRVTWLGLVALVGYLGATAVLLDDPGSGASWAHNPGKTFLAIGVYVVAIAIYYLSKAVRARSGVQLDRGYTEIPPE